MEVIFNKHKGTYNYKKINAHMRLFVFYYYICIV